MPEEIVIQGAEQPITDEGEAVPKKFRIATKHPLPSERVGWSKHFPLLVNSATRSGFGKQAIDSDVMEEGVGTQAGQLNVAFFVDVGLLTKVKRQYLPTDPCVRFVKLLSLDEARARQALYEVISKTWFAEAAVNTLTLRPSLTEETLMKELAIACEISNFQAKTSSFRVLVEYLVYTGVVQRDGENILLPKQAEKPTDSPAPATSGSFVQAPSPAIPTLLPPTPAPSAVPGPPPASSDWDVLSTPLFELRVKRLPEAWLLLNAVLPAYERGLQQARSGQQEEKKS